MDNCGAMERLKARFTATNVEYVVGSFPDMRPIRMYSKILIYSVLHCLSSLDQVEEFVFAALEFLEPGGRMLLGDLPNSDLKARFLNSDSGRIFDAEWQASRKPLVRAASEFQSRAAEIGCLGTFDDNFLVSLLCKIRSKGYSTYLVPQKPLMPFGNTREDIIIAK